MTAPTPREVFAIFDDEDMLDECHSTREAAEAALPSFAGHFVGRRDVVRLTDPAATIAVIEAWRDRWNAEYAATTRGTTEAAYGEGLANAAGWLSGLLAGRVAPAPSCQGLLDSSRSPAVIACSQAEYDAVAWARKVTNDPASNAGLVSLLARLVVVP